VVAAHRHCSLRSNFRVAHVALDRLALARGKGEQPPVQHFGGVYPRNCLENTRQKALQRAIPALFENSAQPAWVLVQILLWLACPAAARFESLPYAATLVPALPYVQHKELHHHSDNLHPRDIFTFSVNRWCANPPAPSWERTGIMMKKRRCALVAVSKFS
jgi:hypothetical protein